MNITFNSKIAIRLGRRYLIPNVHNIPNISKKYDMEIRRHNLEFQITNTTANDTGSYGLHLVDHGTSLLFIRVTSKFIDTCMCVIWLVL